MKKLVSVIINVYNGEKYIKRCLDCIVNQTYKNIEILIINDGSTDNTLKICKEYNDKRIRIINQKNMGLTLARNVGIENALGDYLYFIDVDDYIELDTIEYLYNLCVENNAAISLCKSIRVDSYDIKIKQENEKKYIYDCKQFLCIFLLGKINHPVSIWNRLYKKELFENHRFEDRIINDMAFVHKIYLEADRIVYSNQAKYYYYINEDSITYKNKRKLDRNIDLYKAAVERYEYINKYFPDLIENKIGLIRVITELYAYDNKEIIEYLDKCNVKKRCRELFSIRMLFVKMVKLEKLKMLLFIISPKLYRFFILLYLKTKYCIKKVLRKKT